MSTLIWCCACKRDTNAYLITGELVHPHRDDLYNLPFWMCPRCGNYVGCHHKSANRTKSLGCIPTPELRIARKQLHTILDPLWKDGQMSRGEVYRKISDYLGKQFHTGETKSVEEVNKVISFLNDFIVEQEK